MNPTLATFEQSAVRKYPKRGRCPRSCFADGSHRVGLIPVMSVLDGGAPGDVLQEFCLECGAAFERRGFVLREQPRTLARSRRRKPALRIEPLGKYRPELLDPADAAEYAGLFGAPHDDADRASTC